MSKMIKKQGIVHEVHGSRFRKSRISLLKICVLSACVENKKKPSQTRTHILKKKYITNRYDEPCCRTNDDRSESIEIFEGVYERRRSPTKRRRLKIFTIHRDKCTLPSWCCCWLFGMDISPFSIYLDQFGTNILIYFQCFFMIKYLFFLVHKEQHHYYLSQKIYTH